jgi:hypothetical protein
MSLAYNYYILKDVYSWKHCLSLVIYAKKIMYSNKLCTRAYTRRRIGPMFGYFQENMYQSKRVFRYLKRRKYLFVCVPSLIHRNSALWSVIILYLSSNLEGFIHIT